MRKLLWFVSALLLLTSTRAAANLVPDHEFGFFADMAATLDTVRDDGPGTLTIYMVLTVNYGNVMGIRFSAPNPPCFNGTLIQEGYAFPKTGTAQTGVWVMFDDCKDGQVLVGTLTFSVEGLTGDCCWYVPQPWPGVGDVEVMKCDTLFYPVWLPSSLLINPNDCPSPAPVEDSTWGKIKALYHSLSD